MCGAAMNVNSTFCSRCGASIYNSNIQYNRGGSNHSKIGYFVFALIGSNLILAFTSLIGFISVYFDPSTPHGSHTETYSFWYISSYFWERYARYKSLYKSSDFWSEFIMITMYVAIALCALFIVIALYKAYARINSINKSNGPALKCLIVSTSMAILQLFLLLIIKGLLGNEVSLTVWFWLFAILAIFSLIAEIFLIKADSTANRWTSN